jgi:hypothetical protein
VFPQLLYLGINDDEHRLKLEAALKVYAGRRAPSRLPCLLGSRH